MLYPSILNKMIQDDIFDDFNKSSRPVTPKYHFMKTDIKENEKEYILDIEIPGVKKENVSVELDDGNLVIRAFTSRENEENTKYLRKERFFGSYERTFYVGDELTENDIKAKFEDGILKLTVAKLEQKPEIEKKKIIAIE